MPPSFLQRAVRTLVCVHVEEGSGALQSAQQVLSSVMRDEQWQQTQLLAEGSEPIYKEAGGMK